MNLASWIAFLVLFGGFTWYFRRGALQTETRRWVDSLIMANGLSASVTALFFVWVLPEFAHLSPVYPGPETLVSVLISVGDGIRIGQRSQAQRPVILDSTGRVDTTQSNSPDPVDSSPEEPVS